jgi:hypothetical protein
MTRESLLRFYGVQHFNEPSDFEKDFPSTSEMVSLGLTIGVRRLILLVSDTSTDPKDIIAATKLLAILAGKDEIGVVEETVGRPIGTAGDSELLEAIKRSRKSTG